jgi:thiamine-monophosphate kinase
MPLNEFDIIKKYFTRPSKKSSVVNGVGDDCAVVTVSHDKHLVMSMDTLVSGRHFPQEASAFHIGQRALCTSLSDLAAMGAKPLWFTLGLTLPSVNETWLKEFSEGLSVIADEYTVELIGGDTTKGSLTITIQVHGEVDQGKALLRSNAQIGDAVFVTDFLGDGAAALAMLNNLLPCNLTSRDYLLQRFYAPKPQIAAGQKIAPYANAAIDISDGLLADVEHIARASRVGIAIDIERLPIAAETKAMGQDRCLQWALSGGDDYQLVFTVPPQQLPHVQLLLDQGMITVTHIGDVVEGCGQVQCFLQGELYDTATLSKGYQHFDT